MWLEKLMAVALQQNPKLLDGLNMDQEIGNDADFELAGETE